MNNTYYALILGASSGFGKQIALTLAQDGVNIIGVHLDRATTMPDVEKEIEEIRSYGVDAHFYNINAADIQKREYVLNDVLEIFKKIFCKNKKIFHRFISSLNIFNIIKICFVYVCTYRMNSYWPLFYS